MMHLQKMFFINKPMTGKVIVDNIEVKIKLIIDFLVTDYTGNVVETYKVNIKKYD